MKTTPEPAIGVLVEDFERAGLAVTLRIDGLTRHVSAAVGLALYGITQESLANTAKHAPACKSTVALNIEVVAWCYVRLDSGVRSSRGCRLAGSRALLSRSRRCWSAGIAAVSAAA
jgi:glucose-6-phosphate-specific signal transduction histidine kinase